MAVSTVTISSVVALGVIALIVPWITTVIADSRKNICECYRTSANDYFDNYKFHDFRSISLPNGVPELQSYLPSSANDRTGQAKEDVGNLQSGFISSSEWSDSWGIQSWGKGKKPDTQYRMWNSLSNVFIDRNNDGDSVAKTKLVLRTKRFDAFQSAAEVENSEKNLLFASTRIRARIVGDRGAVAGMFYYRDGMDESDIEVLTRDEPSSIRYSNQPVLDEDGNQIKGSSTKVDLNTDAQTDGTDLKEKRSLSGRGNKDFKWSDWHTHRIDWIKDKSSWYVDDHHYLDKTYGVPAVPSYLVLNMWSDGGQWSGVMSENNEARLEIEWIEMVYNTTSSNSSANAADASGKLKTSEHSDTAETNDTVCEMVCQVDADERVGVVSGGFVPRLAKSFGVKKNRSRGSGTDDREFIFATAIGALTAVILYVVDNIL